MVIRIEITGHAESPTDGTIAVTLSEAPIEPHSRELPGNVVTLQIMTSHGSGGWAELSKAEAATVAVLLNKIVDDLNAYREASPLEKAIMDEGRTITRDELVRALLRLPKSTEINARIAGQYIGIVGLERAGDGNETWWALKCNPRCVRDVLSAWQVPPNHQEEILRGDL
ncbi:hypothetical protein ACWEOZ_32765 [Actinoplanes sp. NPDC004185]